MIVRFITCRIKEGREAEFETASATNRDGSIAEAGVLRFDVLKECGGNAVRAPARKATLDVAHREGLAVMANLPVRGERNGFDWDDPQQVDQQKRTVLADETDKRLRRIAAGLVSEPLRPMNSLRFPLTVRSSSLTCTNTIRLAHSRP